LSKFVRNDRAAGAAAGRSHSISPDSVRDPLHYSGEIGVDRA
jgi:hypothetical protein